MPHVYACLGHSEDCKRSNWNTPFDTLRVCHFLLLIFYTNLRIHLYLFLLFMILFAWGYLCCTNGRYSHSMGNSNGNIHEYWEAIDSTFGLQGGFIWEWVDQVKKPLSPYKYIERWVNCFACWLYTEVYQSASCQKLIVKFCHISWRTVSNCLT